jgi:hypothetical protein
MKLLMGWSWTLYYLPVVIVATFIAFGNNAPWWVLGMLWLPYIIFGFLWVTGDKPKWKK